MKIIQLIDTLNAGGAERVAVNYANTLSNKFGGSFLATTRKPGTLETELNENVEYINLKKTSTFDFSAIKRFKIYLIKNEVTVIHAHTTSYFFAVLTKLSYSKIKIVWHDHQGNRDEINTLKQIPLIIASFFFNGVITVNKKLESWAKKHLYCKNIISIENFVSARENSGENTRLNGKEGRRIVCLANLRNPKNHLFLMEVFKTVQKEREDWSLHLIGNDYGDVYSQKVHKYISDNELKDSVFIYGLKNDIPNILKQCEIGVIVSTFEGLPMALLEYGNASLGVITTDVGSCRELVEGRGVVVESENKVQFYRALMSLIDNVDFRRDFAYKMKTHIAANYAEDVIVKKALAFYESI